MIALAMDRGPVIFAVAVVAVVAMSAATVVSVAKLRSVEAAQNQKVVNAADLITREVAYASKFGALPEGDNRSQLISLAAMNYVVGHVSAMEYGYLEMTHRAFPEWNAGSILTDQAGICGHAATVYAAILRRFHLRTRSVLFYFKDPNGARDAHTANEVYYARRWHFFDPTYGLYYTDASGNALPITAIRHGRGRLHKDAASLTNIVENAALGDDTWFETEASTRVAYG